MFEHIFVAKLFSQVRGSGFNTILGSALLLGAEAELKVALTPFLRLTAKRPTHQAGGCAACVGQPRDGWPLQTQGTGMDRRRYTRL